MKLYPVPLRVDGVQQPTPAQCLVEYQTSEVRITPGLHQYVRIHKRNASVFDKDVVEKVGNARACGNQRRATGVSQAIRTAVLYFHSSAGSVPAELRCGVLRFVALRNA